MRYFGLDAATENVIPLGDHDSYGSADEVATNMPDTDIFWLFTEDTATQLMNNLNKALTL